jgi:hypothetical protein
MSLKLSCGTITITLTLRLGISAGTLGAAGTDLQQKHLK